MFLLLVALFMLMGILSPTGLLSALANPAVMVIFVLIMLTKGFQKLFRGAVLQAFFNPQQSERFFLTKLTLTVSSLSAFINNTPIVAMLIPYVKEWTHQKKVSVGHFLMPLSFATVLGGMLTMVGTSTNLVLNGLLIDFKLPPLVLSDFLWAGLAVLIPGLLYLNFFAFRLLPNAKESPKEEAAWQSYLVETVLKPDARLIGMTVEEAQLRHLGDAFLAEIHRGQTRIAPVLPQTRLEAEDHLFFSGNKEAVYQLVKSRKSLALPDEQALIKYGHFAFAEAVLPVHSSFVGQRVKESDFREKNNATIVAVMRKGRRLTEKMGDLKLNAGDLLLLLVGEQKPANQRDLLYLTPTVSIKSMSISKKIIGYLAFMLLILGIAGLLPLFAAAFFALLLLLMAKLLSMEELKDAVDVDLLMILVSALAVGRVMDDSGLADVLVQPLLAGGGDWPLMWSVVGLYLATLMLTTLITNVAAVSIVFPIAIAMAQGLGQDLTPFMLCIAFAASGDFMTPIGYQTNLMVMGPGRYQFKDYLRFGLPLTFIYATALLTYLWWRFF